MMLTFELENPAIEAVNPETEDESLKTITNMGEKHFPCGHCTKEFKTNTELK